MTNYDKVFDVDVNTDFFYNAPGYYGTKLVVGVISLKNAIERLKKNEYYTLVKYNDGDELPSEYVPLNVDGINLATVNPKLHMHNICRNNGIQMISKLSDDVYLLGPGPDKFSLSFVVNEQVKEYLKELDENYGKSM